MDLFGHGLKMHLACCNIKIKCNTYFKVHSDSTLYIAHSGIMTNLTGIKVGYLCHTEFIITCNNAL